MQLVDEHIIIGELRDEHTKALKEVKKAIENTKIILNPTKKGNGVKPIKFGVIESLKKSDWSDEYPMDLELMRAKPLDAFKRFPNLRVGFEWETGNISSSFRALMKLIKGMDEDQVDLGVHVLPSRAFYEYLTDRVGNIRELLPYLSVFGKIDLEDKKKTLIILVVEYDKLDEKVKLIPKGLDGMSLKRRAKKKTGK